MHMAIEELLNQLNAMKELAREHLRWHLRFTNINVPNHKELIPIIVVTKEYRVQTKKGKNSK